ncbi:hypothetical protein [Catenulispora subtropica]|uniref:Uncharacterized protein n=1 Tax=Catenulispora subtropica TaxID=450798 RepID=A0ABN2SQE7_9ACTN
MGSLRNPVGSLPPTVYWRRRVLVLLAALAALALILYACSGSGSGKKKPVADGKNTSPAASQSSLPTAGGSSAQASSGGTTASGGASGNGPASSSGGPSSSAGAPSGSAGGPGGGPGGTGGATGASGNGGGCQLTLVLSSQFPQYANGDHPAFTLTAFNKGTADCDIDLGPKTMVLNIFSGSDRIWSSADCGVGGSDIRGIAPGSAQTVTYTWNRLRSAAGCPAGGQPAKFGTYYGVVTLAAGAGPAAPAAQSPAKTFELKSGS